MKLSHFAFSALLALSGPVFAGAKGDCTCSKECHEACAKGEGAKHDCQCKTCECSKTGKCDHGKCEHHEHDKKDAKKK